MKTKTIKTRINSPYVGCDIESEFEVYESDLEGRTEKEIDKYITELAFDHIIESMEWTWEFADEEE